MREASPRPVAGPGRRRRSPRSRRCGAARGTAGARQRLLRRDEPGDRVDPRHLERLVAAPAAAGCRAAAARASSCRCPAGREQQVVPACGGDLERAPGALLAAHLGQVGQRQPRARSRSRRSQIGARARRAGRRPPRQDGGPGRARRRRAPPRSPSPRGTGVVSIAARARALGDREHAADAPHAGRRAPSSPTAACSASRSAGICRDAARIASAIGRSKPEPSLRSSRGREVDGDAAARPVELGATRRRCESGASPPARRGRRARRSRSRECPRWMCTSTSTRRGSRPTSACVTARASISPTLGDERTAHRGRVPKSRRVRDRRAPRLARGRRGRRAEDEQQNSLLTMPAPSSVVLAPSRSATGPVSAYEIGVSPSESTQSRLDTRPIIGPGTALLEHGRPDDAARRQAPDREEADDHRLPDRSTNA